MNKGTIKRIIGPVVDVEFSGKLPDIYEALEMENNSRRMVWENELWK